MHYLFRNWENKEQNKFGFRISLAEQMRERKYKQPVYLLVFKLCEKRTDVRKLEAKI